MPPACLPRLLAGLLILCAINTAFAQQAAGGQAVKVRWEGINYSAHIVGTEGGRYRIRYDEHRDGRPDEEWVGIDRLKNGDFSAFKPFGGGATGNVVADMPGAVPTGRYMCSMFISGTGLVSNGEFTLLANAAYERGGTRGRFTYDAGTGRVGFQGGVMDGRTAQYEARKAPTLHLMGNAGQLLKKGEERPVASCERQQGCLAFPSCKKTACRSVRFQVEYPVLPCTLEVARVPQSSRIGIWRRKRHGTMSIVFSVGLRAIGMGHSNVGTWINIVSEPTGHENTGEVIEAGKDVETLEVGDTRRRLRQCGQGRLGRRAGRVRQARWAFVRAWAGPSRTAS